MECDDPLEFAFIAISRVSLIAMRLASDNRSADCSLLGAELFLLANSIEQANTAEKKRLRSKALKLLKDIEVLVCWPRKATMWAYFLELADLNPPPTLRGPLSEIEIKMRTGLSEFTKNQSRVKGAIEHLCGVVETMNPATSSEMDQAPPKEVPTDHPSDINVLLYTVLRDHMYCTCPSKLSGNAPEQHLARLLLKNEFPTAEDGDVSFDMLFSSHPQSKLLPNMFWQDTHLLVSRNPNSRPVKRTRFAETEGDFKKSQSSPQNLVKFVEKGNFCQFISSDINARLCLNINGRELHYVEDPQPLKIKADHIPSISLTKVLQTSSLTARMKCVLACILARSAWLFYGSDWMETKWTGDNIHFIYERRTNCDGSKNNIFAWKPYYCPNFDPRIDSKLKEYGGDGYIHKYPRVQALGTMLVEIEIGTQAPLGGGASGLTGPSEANKDLEWATGYSDLDDPWPKFEYPSYRAAVKNCLDPGLFSEAPFIPGEDESSCLASLERRREILYEEVVRPLNMFFEGTGWGNELGRTPPIELATNVAPPLPPRKWKQSEVSRY